MKQIELNYRKCPHLTLNLILHTALHVVYGFLFNSYRENISCLKVCSFHVFLP